MKILFLFSVLRLLIVVAVTPLPTPAPTPHPAKASCLREEYRTEMSDDEVPIAGLDIVGLDGLLYPDFTFSGYRVKEGGIPVLSAENATIIDVPNNAGPDTQALRSAFKAARAVDGWAVVQLEAGTYELDEPIAVVGQKIVLRGAGREETKLNFTFELAEHEVRWVWPEDSDLTLHKWEGCRTYIYPYGLKRVEYSCGAWSQVALHNTPGSKADPATWCNLGSDPACRPPLGNAQYAFGPSFTGSAWGNLSAYYGSSVECTVEAEWFDGTVQSASKTLSIVNDWVTDAADLENRRLYPIPSVSALNFQGDYWSTCCNSGLKIWGASPRGATEVIGSSVYASVPVNFDYFPSGKLVEVGCNLPWDKAWGTATAGYPLNLDGEKNVPKRHLLRVASIRNATAEERESGLIPVDYQYAYVIEFDQPLHFRIRAHYEEWDTGCFVDHNFHGVKDVGVQDFTLEFHPNQNFPYYNQLKVHGIHAYLVDGIFIERVTVRHAGDGPLWLQNVYEFEVRDSSFEESFYPFQGSTGYVGTSGSRGLLFNCSGFQLRHVDLQYASNHLVHSRSHFMHCDPQAHQFWSTRNMLEIHSSYWFTDPGPLWYNDQVVFAAYSGPYWNGMHMEIGTRNADGNGHSPGGGPSWVFYGNKAYGGTSALVLGGQNERHLVIGNLLHQHGAYHFSDGWSIHPAVEIWEQSYGHYFLNNSIMQRMTNHTLRAVFEFIYDQHDLGGENCGITAKHNKFYYDGYMDHLGVRPQSPEPWGAKLFSSEEPLVVNENTQLVEYDTFANAPVLLYPSVLEWQRGLPGVRIVSPREGPESIAFRGYPKTIRLRANSAAGKRVDHVELYSNWTLVATLKLANSEMQVPVDGVIEIECDIMVESVAQEAAAAGQWTTRYVLNAIVYDLDGASAHAPWSLPITVFESYLQLPPSAFWYLGSWLRADDQFVERSGTSVTFWHDMWHVSLNDFRETVGIGVDGTTSPLYVAENGLGARPAVRFVKGVSDGLAEQDGSGVYDVYQPHGAQETLFIVFNYMDERKQQIYGWNGNLIDVGETVAGTPNSIRLWKNSVEHVSAANVIEVNKTIVFCRLAHFNYTRVYVASDGEPVLDIPRAEYFVNKLDIEIGRTQSNNDLDGHVAEVIYFRTALADDVRQSVHLYLEEYYGVDGKTLDPVPTKPARPSTECLIEDAIDVLVPQDWVAPASSPSNEELPSPGAGQSPSNGAVSPAGPLDISGDSPVSFDSLVVIIAIAAGACVLLTIVALTIFIILRRRKNLSVAESYSSQRRSGHDRLARRSIGRSNPSGRRSYTSNNTELHRSRRSYQQHSYDTLASVGPFRGEKRLPPPPPPSRDW